ncbi:phosphoenolpyruvate mutase [Hungatella hathewayi]|uniref:phosphoenolpyruvate mutase n=1 Tax=Hungatella hathewayi TaxID=154046 RepID=UPI003569308C
MNKTVFLSIGAEFIHGGHIAIIDRAAELGELTVGVLSDEAIMSYRGCPILTYEERCHVISHLNGVSHVIKKDTLGYEKVIRELRPDYVVHGDRWNRNTKQKILELLGQYGGELVEFPYTEEHEYSIFDSRIEQMRYMPEIRRGKLKRALQLANRPLRVLEAHNGLTGLIVEKTQLNKCGEVRQFDAMWISSLCDSTAKGKPDIELVDMTSRENTINEIMEVTTKPVILDGDTGGLTEHFYYNMKTLERMGVSAIIIEDKVGLKKNSLFGTEAGQHQDTIENFCEKIRIGKSALTTNDFMIIARIESLILEQGMADALRRASAYVEAGADGIMIHSKKTEPDEVIEFCSRFRVSHADTALVVVPTTYSRITEEELAGYGVNIIIYANHLIRSAFPAMSQVARLILENERALEAGEMCMPIKDILTLI